MFSTITSIILYDDEPVLITFQYKLADDFLSEISDLKDDLKNINLKIGGREIETKDNLEKLLNILIVKKYRRSKIIFGTFN